MRLSMPSRRKAAPLTVPARAVGRTVTRAAACTAVLAVAAASLSACHSAQPHAVRSVLSQEQVRILVAPDSMEAMVLGEIYRQTLLGQGRDAALVRDPDYSSGQAMGKIEQGNANFLVGCTGNLFYTLDRGGAEELAQERDAGTEEDKDYLEAAHMGMMGALPPTITTVDPSSAPGCADDTLVDLPQNYVPIYAKDLLNRQERFEVSSVTKYLTTDDLDTLVHDAEESNNVAATVALWLEVSFANQQNNAGNIDSDSTDDTDKADTQQ